MGDHRCPLSARSGRFCWDTHDSSLISRFCVQDAASNPLKRDLCRSMFVEYREVSMLTLGARVVSNMNVVRDNQAVGYFLNLENTSVLASPLEVMFTAEDI